MRRLKNHRWLIRAGGGRKERGWMVGVASNCLHMYSQDDLTSAKCNILNKSAAFPVLILLDHHKHIMML